MSGTMRIVSRDAFAAALGEAQQRLRAFDPPRSPVLQQVADQLRFMARATADGRVPGESECTSTTLGPLAVRNFEASDPEFADLLEELDYTFHRYPLLPEGPPARRRGILQVWTGRESFRKLVFEPGVARTLGSADADFVVDGEPGGGPHAQLVWDGVCAHVQAIDPHPLTINGASAWYAEMANGAWMTAGTSTFRFHVEDRSPPPAPVEPTAAGEAALAALGPRRDAGHLYAVLDAARSGRALQLAAESVDPYASLYDGEPGRALDDVAPYLVHFQRDSGLLERLVTEGWGDAWGIYLVSRDEFDAVRRHLRRFLMVEAEGEANRMFFRFYDPRVMRTFAELITPEQRGELLKNLEAILFPGAHGDVQSLTKL